MANEYLQRTPTSTGNRRVFTISFWAKIGSTTTGNAICDTYGNGSNFLSIRFSESSFGVVSGVSVYQIDGGVDYSRTWNITLRDFSAWSHHLFVFNSPAVDAGDRLSYYINGIKITNYSDTYGTFPQNFDFKIDTTRSFQIFRNADANTYGKGELCDYFFIDGQALTPDVFGFYKVGKGYISAGSAQATDFRPGQWVPKTPRVIKTAINNNGGFGVNGFYLPMNDSKNFGADFHGEPNSIITLNEKLPQPRVGVATTASAGIGYTDALRADPYAANLVLALPFVSGGLSSGFGDYSAVIKGSGSPKTITNTGVSIATTASYYGSAIKIDGPTDGAGTATGYMVVPSSSDFQFGTGDFTIETWVYGLDWTGGSANQDQVIYYHNEESSGLYLPAGSLKYYNASAGVLVSGPTLADQQWYHLAAVRNSGTTTLYVGGVSVGSASDPDDYGVSAITIGKNSGNDVNQFRGYLQDLRIYKGVAKYKGGFDVPRPYTPVGIATWRAVPDTTANNFATWNPLVPSVFSSGDRSISNGNLTVTTISTGNGTNARSTIGVSTGRWYAETYLSGDTLGGGGFLGVLGIGRTDNQTNASSGDHINYYGSNGNKYDYDNGSPTISSYGSTYTTGDIIGISINADNGEVIFYKNGVSQGIAKTFPSSQYPLFIQIEDGASAQTVTCNINFGQNPSFSGNTTAGTYTDTNGKGLFKYQPPSGFLALCEDNLPTPAIANPGRHFRTVLYTGDGNSGRSIVGVGFTSDLVWIKCRNTARVHGLWDSVRGASNYLVSSSTAVETSDTTNGLQSFNSDGFSIGSVGTFNTSTDTYVAWCWKAGAGTTSTNTNGSITSVVSVNQDAGFSIVSYTGTAASATVGHGLGKAPGLIILKNRDDGTRNWPVYHKSFSIADFIYLNLTNAKSTDNSTWGTTNSSIFTLGNGVTPNTSWNANGQRFIAYCWAEIEGFSKFGSYVGNGSADGPFVYCGFKPAFILIKSSSGVDNWRMYDNARGASNGTNFSLYPNLSNIEDQANDHLDYLSNGFKLRGNTNNGSGVTYIFAAYAESPFQTANSK